LSEEKEIPISSPGPGDSSKQPEERAGSYNENPGNPTANQDPGQEEDTSGSDQAAKSAETADSAGKSVTEELEELRKEKERVYDLYLRKQAEFDNYKKRLERDKAESIRYANESLICELLPVIDNFELAITAAEEKDQNHSHYQGVKLILKQLKDVLAKHELADIPAVGEPFDPAHHEAIMQVSSEQHPPNTVVQQQRKGYKLKGKLIRPAMVVVSKKIETAAEEDKKESKD